MVPITWMLEPIASQKPLYAAVNVFNAATPIWIVSCAGNTRMRSKTFWWQTAIWPRRSCTTCGRCARLGNSGLDLGNASKLVCRNQAEAAMRRAGAVACSPLEPHSQDELATKAARQGSATAVATIAEGKQSSKTPGPAPGSVLRLPTGTNASTPIAAQVLQTVRKPSRSPGGIATAQRRSKTPGRGDFLTPGTHGKALAASCGPATLSRLARSAGPVVSPDLAMALGNGGPASVPRLRSRNASALGSSRLQPRALVPAAAVAAGVVEEEREGHVALPFGMPAGPGAAAGRQWNVSPVVASIDGGAGGQGGDCGCGKSEHGGVTAAAAAQLRQSSHSKRKA